MTDPPTCRSINVSAGALSMNRILFITIIHFLPRGLHLLLSYSKVPAFLNVTDIAGLVKGASEGQGLGNAFLSHIKACDALFHLCRKYILYCSADICKMNHLPSLFVCILRLVENS